jgi:hypothetical protein
MLLGVRNRDEPTLSPRHPQLISGAEIGWRIIERAGPYLNFVSAVDDRKDGRSTHGTEVAIVGRKLPASSLTSDRHLARLPHSEEVAERSGLLPADLAVAKADPHRSPADLKLHLTAVAATRSLQHGISTVEDAHQPHLAGSDGKPGPVARGITSQTQKPAWRPRSPPADPLSALGPGEDAKPQGTCPTDFSLDNRFYLDYRRQTSGAPEKQRNTGATPGHNGAYATLVIRGRIPATASVTKTGASGTRPPLAQH